MPGMGIFKAILAVHFYEYRITGAGSFPGAPDDGNRKAQAVFQHATLADAQAAGAVTWNYGLFINTIIAFFIIALAIFMIVKAVNKARKAMDAKKAKEAIAAAPVTKDCPFCATAIPVKATRCPHCTSEIK